jgi:hypothetical protein
MDPDFGGLARVPKKLLGFFDKGMPQRFEFERFLFYHVIAREWEALSFDAI